MRRSPSVSFALMSMSVQMFVPTGTPSIWFVRALAAQGVFSKGLMVIGVGETDDADLPFFDNSVLGVHTSFYYASTLDNPENTAFPAKAGSEVQGCDLGAVSGHRI